MYWRNRTQHEITAYLKEKKIKRQAQLKDIAQRKVEKIKLREFKDNHISVDKFVTYSNKRANINKKSFVRLYRSAISKWGSEIVLEGSNLPVVESK